MKWITLSLAALAFLVSSSAQAQNTTIEGVDFPNTLKAGSSALVLNGGGVREKMWIDLYVGALYLPVKMTSAKAIVAANNPMAIRLEIVSTLITSEKMSDAVEEGFGNSLTDKETLRSEIDAFKGAFSEAIVEGDVFEMVYVPEKGTLIYKNSQLIKTIKGYKFKSALFGIWLGTTPADSDLKNGMLGK